MTTQTVKIETHKEVMLDRLRAGRDYEFLTMAQPYLDVRPEDAYVRLMASRSYLKLGLVPAARELLDRVPPAIALPPEFEAVRAALADLPGGPIPWRTHKERFDANLGALAKRGIDVSAIREAWGQHESDYQLFRDEKGAEQVRECDAAGRWDWFPTLCDHDVADAERALPDGISANMPGPYAFEGLGLGGYFERIYRKTVDTFLGFSCALLVVEPRPARLAALLHLRDWEALLSDERVMLFVGEGCMEALRAAWDNDLDLPWPQLVMTTGTVPADATPRVADVVEAAANARENAVRESMQDLGRRYAHRTPQFWAKRFAAALDGSGEPLRILTAVSTHTTFLQHSIRDTKRAFESLGHKCVVLTDDTPYGITGPLTFHNAIRELDPDLFFILDHLRSALETAVPKNLPILTWDQDQLPHVLTRENLQRIAPHDFLAGCSKSRCVAMGCNPAQLLNARVPTCPEQFGGDALSESEQNQYACDVSFVSHASQTPREFHDQECEAYQHPTMTKLLGELFSLLPPMLEQTPVADHHVMTAVLAEAMQRCRLSGLDDEVVMRLRNWYLWRLGDRLFRHQALEWVADWARRTGRLFRIYGRGWEKHPTLSEFAAGPARNGRELLCIYRASRINLQLMPAGFIHQRSLDGLAGGGFFLSRTVPDDLRGKTLRKLDARISELKIRNTGELLGHRDDSLRTLLASYVGDWLERGDHYTFDLLTNIHISAELLQPDEAFTDFEEILFDSAERFAEVADHFLTDDAHRRGVADRMRQIVIERFSYRSTVDQFLRAMSSYLQTAAAG